jgi:hypothetical protein
MKKNFDKATQILLPILTIIGFSLTSLKMPQYGLPIATISQIFWLYSGYQSWKKAGQIGIFITAVLLFLVYAFGVINYWFIK